MKKFEDDNRRTFDFGKETGSKLVFQNGPVKEYGVNGTQVIDVINAVIERMKKLNSIKHDNYNDETIEYLEKARTAQRHRDFDRANRGVEGTNKD